VCYRNVITSQRLDESDNNHGPFESRVRVSIATPQAPGIAFHLGGCQIDDFLWDRFGALCLPGALAASVELGIPQRHCVGANAIGQCSTPAMHPATVVHQLTERLPAIAYVRHEIVQGAVGQLPGWARHYTAVCQRRNGCIEQEFLLTNRDNLAAPSTYGISASSDECSKAWQAAYAKRSPDDDFRHSCRCEPKAGLCADVADESDTTLMARIAQRDQLALNEIHSRYHGRITRFVRRWALSGELADHISNETLWIVWQSAARFRGASSVSTWILGIANNLRRKTLQHQVRAGAWQSLPRNGPDDAYEPGAQTEVSGWVALALTRLPAEQRVVIELAYTLAILAVKLPRL
jgi:DNA-directed RNA polymerase specialized sigma24 family protein